MLMRTKITKQRSILSSTASIALSAFLSTSESAFVPATRYCTYSPSQSSVIVRKSNIIARSFSSSNENPPNKTIMSKKLTRNEDDILILPYKENTHNSVKIIINEDDEISDQYKTSFRSRLEATIEACRHLQKSALWITVSMRHASVIENMVDIKGLEFHHATGRNANLCLWLKDDVENKIPEYATHQVGVGAMVVNSKNEILCVRELRNNYRPWKIPGGLAELGEQIDEAAIREVKEETGIDCRFSSVLSFRHTHGLQFGRSDLYFVCRLEPIEIQDKDSKATIIPEPVAQSGEIAAVSWVPFDEYRAMVNGDNPHPMMQKVLDLFDGERDIEKTVVSSIVPGRKPSPIYHAPVGKQMQN